MAYGDVQGGNNPMPQKVNVWAANLVGNRQRNVGGVLNNNTVQLNRRRMPLKKRLDTAKSGIAQIAVAAPTLGGTLRPRAQAIQQDLDDPNTNDVDIGNDLTTLEGDIVQWGPVARKYAEMDRLLANINKCPGSFAKTGALQFIGRIDVAFQQLNLVNATTAMNQLRPLLPKVAAGSRRGAMHEELTKDFRILDKLALVKGDTATNQNDLDPNRLDVEFTTLNGLCDRMEPPNRRDVGTLQQIEAAARQLLQTIQNKGGQLSPTDKKKAEYAKKRITEARLLAKAKEYEALGEPSTWNQTVEAQAAKLQAEYYFEEGVMLAKEGDFGGKPLKPGQGGVNGAWFINRADPTHKGGEGKSLSIFKPGDAEEGTLPGYKAGSGVIREVMAKSLSDSLSAFTGYDVGVCPTTIAEIDSTKLPDNEGNVAQVPTRLGSMQNLAPSKGGLDKLFEPNNPDRGLLAKIPKENTDQIAVFDLLTNAADRHPGNLLVQEQPDGSGRLVPIDHGFSMPDRKTLMLTRRRMIAPQNTLLNPDADPNGQMNQPLGQDALDGLARMNPAQIEADMRQARDNLTNAHPNMNADMTDEHLAVMRRSAEFLKAIAPMGFSVAQLFEINQRYAARIHDPNVLSNQVPALANTIANEFRAANVAEGEVATIEPGGTWKQADALGELGWCLGIPANLVENWIRDNAERVAKILKARIVNPQVQAQLNDIVQRLGGPNNPAVVQLNLGGKSPKEQHYALTAALTRKEKAQGKKQLDESELTDFELLFHNLKGDVNWNELLTFNPAEKTNIEGLEGAKDILNTKIDMVRSWLEFKALGGEAEFLRLGLPLHSDMDNISVVVNQMRACQNMEGGLTGTIDQMDANAVNQAVQASTNTALQNAQVSYMQMPTPGPRDAFVLEAQAVTADLNNNVLGVAKRAAMLQKDAATGLGQYQQATADLQAAANQYNGITFGTARQGFANRAQNIQNEINAGRLQPAKNLAAALLQDANEAAGLARRFEVASQTVPLRNIGVNELATALGHWNNADIAQFKPAYTILDNLLK